MMFMLPSSTKKDNQLFNDAHKMAVYVKVCLYVQVPPSPVWVERIALSVNIKEVHTAYLA